MLLPSNLIRLRSVLILVSLLRDSARHLGTDLGWTQSKPTKWWETGRHGDGASGGIGLVVRTGPTSTKLELAPPPVLISTAPRLLKLFMF